MKRLFIPLLCCLFALSFASCASLRGHAVDPQSSPSDNSAGEDLKGDQGSTAAPSVDPDEESDEKAAPFDSYILGPDDIVRVAVEQHPEWSGEFPVRPDGSIYITGVGEIRIEDLTKDGAEIAITSRLERFINNPRVVIDIARYASQVVYVLGAVERPGRYSTEGKNMTVRDAVVAAGLPVRFAATNRVHIITPSIKKPSRRVINLHRVLDRGQLENNLRLVPGDIVYVPQTVLGSIIEFVSSIVNPVATNYPSASSLVTPVP